LGNALFAGGNAVGIRFSNRELDPLWGSGLRFALTALIFAALVAGMRLAFPRGRALVGGLLYGVFNFAGASGLAYLAFVEIQAGLGQTILALVPLFTLLLAVGWRQERFTAAAAIGTALALVGVALMARAPIGESVSPLAFAAALGSALCFAQAAVLIRRFPSVHPVTMNGIGSAVGAVILIAGSFVVGESAALPGDAETWAALAYLVAVGSVLVFLLYLYVLGSWDASRAAYVFVLIPFVAVIASAWLDDEQIRLSLVFGGALVLGGVYVGALRPSRIARTRISR